MEFLTEIMKSPSQVIFFSLDKDYKYLVFNKNHSDTMKHIWGVNIEKKHSMLDYIHSYEDRQKAKDNFDRALAGDEFVKVEEYGDSSLNRSFYEDFYSPLKNDLNEIIGLTVYVTDITERRLAEIKISDNEKLLNSIYQNINEAIYRSNDVPELISVNDAYLKMFGFQSIEEVLSLDPKELYENYEDRRAYINKMEKDGSCSNMEVVYRRKDGSTFQGALSSIKNVNEEGITFYNGAIRDITKQKQNDLKIKRQARVNEILMGFTLKYLNIDINQIDQAINSSLKEIGEFCESDRVYVFDIDQEKETCSNTFEWVSENTSPEIDNCQNIPLNILEDEMSYRNGIPVVIENYNSVKSPEFKKLLIEQEIKSQLTVPSMDQDQFVGFIGIDYVKGFHKPTDEEKQILVLFAEILVLLRNRVAQQMERQNLLETATHQNERLKDFSYITSHNIRSSVANILGLLNLQESDGQNPEINTLLKVSANKLNDTLVNINEILNFEREFEELNHVECRPYQIITNIIETLNAEISEGCILIKNDIPEDLIIHGFHAYLESVFHNLITNAIKYGTTPDNKTIEISSRTESGSCCISFRDYGLGIDLERHGENLFSLGSRFHSDKSDGQGLGLFMTKRQVDAMKGKIEVVSEINRGTTFNVWLND